MDTRFVVVDQGLDSGVYKMPTNQTARLINEFGNENMEIFDTLEDAKHAVLQIVNRCEEASKRSHRDFSFRANPAVESRKAQISDLTEDQVETFFL